MAEEHPGAQPPHRLRDFGPQRPSAREHPVFTDEAASLHYPHDAALARPPTLYNTVYNINNTVNSMLLWVLANSRSLFGVFQENSSEQHLTTGFTKKFDRWQITEWKQRKTRLTFDFGLTVCNDEHRVHIFKYTVLFIHFFNILTRNKWLIVTKVVLFTCCLILQFYYFQNNV